MTEHPNYRDITAPLDKPYPEYTYVERRAKLYDMIEQAGHYRNLQRTQRQIAEQFGVSHTTIGNDISAVNEWIAQNVGDNAEVELESLKNTAVQELVDQGRPDDAYRIMAEHYKILQDMGVKDREPDEIEIDWRDYVSRDDT